MEFKSFKKFLIEEELSANPTDDIPEYQKHNPEYNKPGTVLNLPFQTAIGIKAIHVLAGEPPRLDGNSSYDKKNYSSELNKIPETPGENTHKRIFSHRNANANYHIDPFFGIGVWNPNYKISNNYGVEFPLLYPQNLKKHREHIFNSLKNTHDLVALLAHPGHSAESLHNHFLDMIHLANQEGSDLRKNDAHHQILNFALNNPNKNAVKPLIDKLMKVLDPNSTGEFGLEPIETDEPHITGVLYSPENKKYGLKDLFPEPRYNSVFHHEPRSFLYHVVNSPHVTGKQVYQIEQWSRHPSKFKEMEIVRKEIQNGLMRKNTELQNKDVFPASWELHKQRHSWTLSPEYEDISLPEREWDENTKTFKQTPSIMSAPSDSMKNMRVPAMNESKIKDIWLNVLKESKQKASIQAEADRRLAFEREAMGMPPENSLKTFASMEQAGNRRLQIVKQITKQREQEYPEEAKAKDRDRMIEKEAASFAITLSGVPVIAPWLLAKSGAAKTRLQANPTNRMNKSGPTLKRHPNDFEDDISPPPPDIQIAPSATKEKK